MRTERLSLSRPEPGDIDAILAVHSDPRTVAHNPSDALATRAEAEALFARWDEHWRIYGFGYWVVRHRDAPVQLGFCGLKFMSLRERRVLNLFYRLDPASWGDGVAGEAATAVVRWAVARFPDQPVVARVRPENIASQRVATRAGLVRAEELDENGFDGVDWIYAST
ncbi:MAG: GNAT family N-acetyltransferase [Actinophytocola sp.]|nr:GNAT family N-acetyltransferase [Actinophytocola sp.]